MLIIILMAIRFILLHLKLLMEIQRFFIFTKIKFQILQKITLQLLLFYLCYTPLDLLYTLKRQRIYRSCFEMKKYIIYISLVLIFCFSTLLNTSNIYAIGLDSDYADSYGHHIYTGSFGAAIFENLCGEARDEYSASENIIGYVKVEDFFNNQTDDFSSLKQIYKSTGENQLDEVHIMGFDGRGTDYINNTINDGL